MECLSILNKRYNVVELLKTFDDFIFNFDEYEIPKQNTKVTSANLLFKIKLNDGNKLTVQGIELYSLLMLIYLVSFEKEFEKTDYEVDIYNKIVLINRKIYDARVKLDKEKKELDILYFENDKKEKIQKEIMKIQEESFTSFIKFLNQIDVEILIEFVNKITTHINSRMSDFENIISTSVYQTSEKIYKLKQLSEEIFQNEISILLNMEEFEINNKGYLVKMIQDSFFIILTSLVLKLEPNFKEKVVYYSENLWFIHFFTLLLNEYKKNKINLLKLNTIDLLLYGIENDELDEVIKKYKFDFNINDNDLNFETKVMLYYLLLSFGISGKQIYKGIPSDLSNKTRFSFIYGDKKLKRTFFEFESIKKQSEILELVLAILSSNDENVKTNLEDLNNNYLRICQKYEQNKFEENRRKTLIENFSSILNESIRNLLIAVKNNNEMSLIYNKNKDLYFLQSNIEQKEYIFEFLKLILNFFNINTNTKDNILKNIITMIRKLYKENKEIKIQNNVLESIGGNVVVVNNIFDNNSNERFFRVNSGFELSNNSYLNVDTKNRTELKIGLYLKLLIEIYLYINIIKEKKCNFYNEIKTTTEKEMFFKIVSDVLLIIIFKENKILLPYAYIIREENYLDYFLKKCELMFSITSNSQIEPKIFLKDDSQNETGNYLILFKEALLYAYKCYDTKSFIFVEDKKKNEGNEEKPSLESNENITARKTNSYLRALEEKRKNNEFGIGDMMFKKKQSFEEIKEKNEFLDAILLNIKKDNIF